MYVCYQYVRMCIRFILPASLIYPHLLDWAPVVSKMLIDSIEVNQLMCAMCCVALFMAQNIHYTYPEQTNVFEVRVHVQSVIGWAGLSTQGTRARVCCGT